jgi:acyl-coenzyme A thioesterase PaaI-like protein
MPESLRSRLERHAFNLFPAYFATGGRVTYIAADWREVRVEIPRSLRTRNYVGTIFGGSMYGAVDPFYMIMLIRNLGPGYVVWDKAAAIRFRRPGRSTLRAVFTLRSEELEAIRAALETEPSIDRTYTVELTDAEGRVCAIVEKTEFVGRADAARRRAGRRTALSRGRPR